MIHERTMADIVPTTIEHLPFDVIALSGSESTDFLHRITTSDLSTFKSGEVRHTCLVSDKGRIIDTVWLLHQGDHLLMAASAGMADTIVPWLQKYIIMEEIVVRKMNAECSITMLAADNSKGFSAEYFGFPVTLTVRDEPAAYQEIPSAFELWRINHGIPRAKKEIVQEYNPLELNLWNWISFTKGCYIGQEVIARLDTYQKIQRALCRISSDEQFQEQDVLFDGEGKEIGKITSVINDGDRTIGLAMVRNSHAVIGAVLKSRQAPAPMIIDKIFRKEDYGRN